MGSGEEEWGVGVGEWGVAACIDPPVAGHIMPYPAKAPPPPLSSRIASRTPPAVTQRLAGVGFHRRVFDCTPSTRDANRDLVWLRQLDGGAGGGMCETWRGKPLFRGQKVTPANLIFLVYHIKARFDLHCARALAQKHATGNQIWVQLRSGRRNFGSCSNFARL